MVVVVYECFRQLLIKLNHLMDQSKSENKDVENGHKIHAGQDKQSKTFSFSLAFLYFLIVVYLVSHHTSCSPLSHGNQYEL